MEIPIDIEENEIEIILDSSTIERDPIFTSSPAFNVIDSGDGSKYLSNDGSYKTIQDGDEKVKYKSNDPTAGYVQDKFVAGSGISVSEGTGGNSNKLVIENTDKGSDLDLSGKQDKLTAGTNIDITSNVISATDTTYTAGVNVNIQEGVISATNTTYSNSDWNLKDLNDVDDTSKANGKILQVRQDGKHEYVDLPNPDLSSRLLKSGDTMTGTLVNVEEAQVRNIKLVSAEPDVLNMTEGTIYLVYE